jgi:hypothetical protein
VFVIPAAANGSGYNNRIRFDRTAANQYPAHPRCPEAGVYSGL